MSASAIATSMSSQTPGAAAKPPHLDAKVANELDALWRSIFERSHAGETRGEIERAPGVANSATHDGADARELTKGRPEERGTQEMLLSPGDSQVVAARESNTSAAAPAFPAGFARAASIESPRTAATAEPETPMTGVSVMRAVPEDAELAAPVAKRVQSNDEAARATAEQAHTDEAVSVFMQGGSVTINVRDAVLTEDEALRCAFETARTLTGERAALRALILNGRTVYRQSPPPAATASPTLIFAC